MSNKDYWGLNGYSFEPEYSERGMETPDETIPSKNGSIVDIAVRWESLKKTGAVSTLTWVYQTQLKTVTWLSSWVQ